MSGLWLLRRKRWADHPQRDQHRGADEKAGKAYEPVVYDGAGHGFMRGGEKEFPNATEADKKARDAAWVRLKELLKKI